MSEEPKNKGGRPSHQPTDRDRKQVESLVGFGIPQKEICGLIGISLPTLLAHYRDELDLGSAKANSLVAQSLFNKATGDGPSSVTAAIFWLKTRARWKETQTHEVSGPNGGPIPTVALDTLTHEQLVALEPVLAALAGPGGAAGEGEGGDPETGG